MDLSKFFSLNLKDIGKGFIITVLSTALGLAYEAINGALLAKALPSFSGWKEWLFAGVFAGVSYLMKNLFTNSSGQFLKPE